MEGIKTKRLMKKIILSLIFAASVVASFAQSGAQQFSGVFYRVNDSTTYQTAAAAKHSAGYADIYFNNQAIQPHFDVWNGSSYDHIFNFASGGSFTLTDGNLTTANGTAVDQGGTQTGDINEYYAGFNKRGTGDYLRFTQQDNTGGFGFPLWGRAIFGDNDATIADSVDGTTRLGASKINADIIEHYVEHKSTGELDVVQVTGGDAKFIHTDASSNQTILGVQDNGLVVQVEGNTGVDGDVVKKVGSVWTIAPDAGGGIDGGGTTNELPFWVDSNTLGSLTTATYPSLSELTTVKGVTSPIQTQLNAKLTGPSNSFGFLENNGSGTLRYAGNSSRALTTAGATIQADNKNVIYLNSASPFNLTVDQLLAGTDITLINKGAGVVTLVAGTGVTLGGTYTLAQNDKGVIFYETATAPIVGIGTTINDATSSVKGIAKLYTTTGTNVDGSMDQNSINTELATKQATLVSGTNIKTVGGVPILGPGDLPIPAWALTGTSTLTGDATISGNFNKYFTGTGGLVIGHTALTNANARFQIRGNANSTNNMVLFEDNLGSAKFTMTDAGTVTWPSSADNTWSGPVLFNANATLGLALRDNRANNLINQSSSATASNRTATIGNGTYGTIELYTAGRVLLTQQAQASVAPAAGLTLVGGAHTGLTALAEVNDVYFNLSRTIQRATGTVTQDRFVRISAPTVSFVGSSTVGTGSTVWIEGAPVAGTNAIITNPYALNVASGKSLFGGDLQLSGALMPNNSAGTSGQVLASAGAGSPPTWTNQGARTLNVNTSQVVLSSTSETDLYRYSVPASSLSIDGNSIEASFSGAYSNSGNTKVIRVYFGTTKIFDSGNLINTTGTNHWKLEVQVIRTGAATQKCNVVLTSSAGVSVPLLVSYITAAETLSGALDLAVTGQSSAASPEITKETGKTVLVQ